MSTPDLVLQNACNLLPAATASKRWMTARSLARRIRNEGDAALKNLGQDKLSAILLAHFDHTRQHQRLVRPSRLPSSKTLETLWGRTLQGEREQGESPILRHPQAIHIEALQAAQLQPAADIEEELAPNLFISYNHQDEAEALRIGGQLDRLGWNTWVAGERIAPGGHINQHVLDAMASCETFALYLSQHSLGSIWVSKELLYSRGNTVRQFAIVDGSDPVLGGLFSAWRAGRCAAELEPQWQQMTDNLRSMESDFDQHLRRIAAAGRIFMHLPQGSTPAPGTALPGLEFFPGKD